MRWIEETPIHDALAYEMRLCVRCRRPGRISINREPPYCPAHHRERTAELIEDAFDE